MADFLTSYVEYVDHGHAPRRYHEWAGISLISAALERKVWLPWEDTFNFIPNTYVFLVGKPASGKSSALNKAIGLVTELNARTNADSIKLLPSSMSEAKFVDLMSVTKAYNVGTEVKRHASAYYFSSEASNTLRPLYGGGDLIPCLTDFYDCPSEWKKELMKNTQPMVLFNVCVNLIAGCTFDYLSKLVTNENIMGGFASRVLYIIEHDVPEREAKFQGGLGRSQNHNMRENLLKDLHRINLLQGPFSAENDFARQWERWFKQHQNEIRLNPSEKMQSLLARKPTNLFKICMCLSAASASDLVMRAEHLEKGLALLDRLDQDLPKMIREAQAAQTTNQGGLNQAIFKIFEGWEPGKVVSPNTIKHKLVLAGFDPQRISSTILGMIESRVLERDGPNLRLLVNPNSHL